MDIYQAFASDDYQQRQSAAEQVCASNLHYCLRFVNCPLVPHPLLCLIDYKNIRSRLGYGLPKTNIYKNSMYI